MGSEHLPRLECQVPGAPERQLLPIPGAKVQSALTQPHSRGQGTKLLFLNQSKFLGHKHLLPGMPAQAHRSSLLTPLLSTRVLLKSKCP